VDCLPAMFQTRPLWLRRKNRRKRWQANRQSESNQRANRSGPRPSCSLQRNRRSRTPPRRRGRKAPRGNPRRLRRRRRSCPVAGPQHRPPSVFHADAGGYVAAVPRFPLNRRGFPTNLRRIVFPTIGTVSPALPIVPAPLRCSGTAAQPPQLARARALPRRRRARDFAPPAGQSRPPG
jgi:hypothetical protein